MTVSIPSTGGFQLAVLTQSGNSQAGTLTVSSTAPPGFSFPTDSVTTLGSIQYVADTVETTSWTFSWTPPATNVGNVVLYVTGGSFSSNFSNSYTITAPSTTPAATSDTDIGVGAHFTDLYGERRRNCHAESVDHQRRLANCC